MDWIPAPEIKKRIETILPHLNLPHIDPKRLTYLRGYGSKGRAIARIWSLPTVWQLALNIQPQYVIEVIAERFDKMRFEDQDRTLIHELMHIPKTFSGALVSHRGPYHRINHRTVEVLYQRYLENKRK